VGRYFGESRLTLSKPILVEKLVKCKMQYVSVPVDHRRIHLTGIRDNLEFLQWIKRFWEQNYHDNGYDPVIRRRGAPTDTPVTIAPLAPTHRGGVGSSLSTTGGNRAGGRTPVSGYRSASTQPNEAIQALQAQLKEMSTHMEGLEKERDFYFAKVRSILVCL
jgi:RP/EB family microtubule-associated protein